MLSYILSLKKSKNCWVLKTILVDSFRIIEEQSSTKTQTKSFIQTEIAQDPTYDNFIYGKVNTTNVLQLKQRTKRKTNVNIHAHSQFHSLLFPPHVLSLPQYVYLITLSSLTTKFSLLPNIKYRTWYQHFNSRR